MRQRDPDKAAGRPGGRAGPQPVPCTRARLDLVRLKGKAHPRRVWPLPRPPSPHQFHPLDRRMQLLDGSVQKKPGRLRTIALARPPSCGHDLPAQTPAAARRLPAARTQAVSPASSLKSRSRSKSRVRKRTRCAPEADTASEARLVASRPCAVLPPCRQANPSATATRRLVHRHRKRGRTEDGLSAKPPAPALRCDRRFRLLAETRGRKLATLVSQAAGQGGAASRR